MSTSSPGRGFSTTTTVGQEKARATTILTTAVQAVRYGASLGEAVGVVLRHRPSAAEVAAARRENLAVLGGGTPEVLRTLGFRSKPMPARVLKLRKAVDEVLARAEEQAPR
jgi:hypothetical protein